MVVDVIIILVGASGVFPLDATSVPVKPTPSAFVPVIVIVYDVFFTNPVIV